MSVTLTVNGSPFEYPSPGDSPGWGEDATAWAEEVTDVLTSLLGGDDILETTFNIANNVSSPTNITGLNFNTGTVRAAIVEYSVYRVSDTNPSGKAESGIMNMVFDNSASSTNKWLLAVGNIAGNSGVIFSLPDSGQMQYISTDIGASNYSGVMKFVARSLAQ